MSDSYKSNRDDYSRFDNMSTEELEEILRLDFQLPDDEESDVDAIFYITEVIEKREKEHLTGRFTDVQAAWASFKENYLPYAEDSKSLYDFEDSEIQAGLAKTPFEKFFHPQRKRKVKRVAAIAATLIVILMTGTLTANALGFDLWGAVAKWTRDTFVFSNSAPQETMSGSLQETLDKYKITAELVPTGIPDGYAPENVDVIETPLKTTFNATYKSTDDEISIIIVSLSEPLPKTYEKDSDDVIVYTVNGIEHYIMTNLERIKVAWKTENYECSISGNLSVDEAETMIDSIYERK